MRIVTVLFAALALLVAGSASAQPGPNGKNNYGLCKAHFAGSEEGRANKSLAEPFVALIGLAAEVAIAACEGDCAAARETCDNQCAADEAECLDTCEGDACDECGPAREACEGQCGTDEEDCVEGCQGTCDGDAQDDCVEDWCQENGKHPVHEDKNPGRDTASPGQQKKQNGNGNGNGENGGDDD